MVLYGYTSFRWGAGLGLGLGLGCCYVVEGRIDRDAPPHDVSLKAHTLSVLFRQRRPKSDWFNT